MADDSTKCLLDVLLKLHIEDQVLDEDGVRQEVDTFIVGACTPEVQEKIHQELDSVLGADSKGPLSVADLNELKYLECVPKGEIEQVLQQKGFSGYLEFVLEVLVSN
ncbi:hypothetical protein CEXT_661931 [Caerostris extrusa]|uniref:Cytochrome P450 n=1 Tax=Caerostris extrusa TaxID=172846 RepID=A0AAV4XYW2_CAEEX|nr:hypothetical protein CEXT_661931 [Caerostris extrusa]